MFAVEEMARADNGVLKRDDSTLLKSLITSGNKESVVDFLYQKGVTVNTSLDTHYCWKTSPLHVAVDVKPTDYHHDLVEYFITHGANCNILDNHGYSPLHHAAIQCNYSAVKALLDAGADVNRVTEPTPIDWGKMPHHVDSDISYPLHLALKAQNVFGNTQRLDGEDYTVLVDLVTILLSQGANCQVFDNRGYTPLHYAANLHDVTPARMLLDAGAVVNANSKPMLETPLFFAKDSTMLKFLLSRNADPEFLRVKRETILHSSISNIRKDMIRYLISDVPALLQSKYTQGWSPLRTLVSVYCGFIRSLHQTQDPAILCMLSNSHGHVEETIYLLVTAGCDPTTEILHNESWNNWRAGLMYYPQGVQIVNTLENTAYNPRSLLNLSTVRIRSMLRKNVHRAVDTLILPTSLKDTLLLKATDITKM